MAAPVLLFQLGQAPPSVGALHGPYTRWFETAWDGPLRVSDGRAGGRGPDPRDFAGVLITGSASSLVHPDPWMDDAAELVVRAHDAGVPTLGICFGHQLIAYAFGGRVVRNPKGWEIGTCQVELNAAGRNDPLFQGLGPTLEVNETHQDIVEAESLPDRLRVLGESDLCAVQVLAVDDHTRGVQFHPEIDGAIGRGYIEARRAVLNGLDADALIARTRDCPDAVAVLQNFKRHFVKAA